MERPLSVWTKGTDQWFQHGGQNDNLKRQWTLAKITMCGICCCLFVDNHSSRSRYKVGFYPLSDLSIPSYFFFGKKQENSEHMLFSQQWLTCKFS